MTIESAEAFLTGIITDTIGFRTQNMKPDTFTLAARLANMGLDIFDIYDKAQAGRSFSAIKYWGQGLQKIQQENGIVWTSLSIEDRQAAGYSGNDDADLVNVLSSIENSKLR